jgi:hypothetical protein
MCSRSVSDLSHSDPRISLFYFYFKYTNSGPHDKVLVALLSVETSLFKNKVDVFLRSIAAKGLSHWLLWRASVTTNKTAHNTPRLFSRSI